MFPGREIEAAAVAARLKAFAADPSRVGPRFARGEEPLPEGGIVLRFAQGKIPSSIAPSAVEAHQLRRAAELFVRRVCLWDRADHYQALCARADAAAETLKENYHLLMALLHPDRQEGVAEPWPEACAQRVNLAYATLGDEKARREYDSRRRSERPRVHAAASAAPRRASARTRDIRFAKSLMAVSLVVAVVVGAGLVVHDDEWSDQSVLQASLARLRISPLPGADRPRYVGAMQAQRRASDAAAADDTPIIETILRPVMRAFSSGAPKSYAPPVLPPPAPEANVAATPATAAASSAVAVAPVPVPSREPLILAQATLPVAQAPSTPAPAGPAPATAATPSNAQIEDLVVALVSYYEAGDANRIVDLVDSGSIGFFKRNRMRQAYADFFSATKSRQLRIDRLAWSTSPGAATARGEALVMADYRDRDPLQKRVDMQIDIVLRDGKARLARLDLFPETP